MQLLNDISQLICTFDQRINATYLPKRTNNKYSRRWAVEL